MRYFKLELFGKGYHSRCPSEGHQYIPGGGGGGGQFSLGDEHNEKSTEDMILAPSVIATFRLEHENDNEYEVSLLGARITVNKQKFSKCACSKL